MPGTWVGKTFPAFLAHAQPTILRIWKGARAIILILILLIAVDERGSKIKTNNDVSQQTQTHHCVVLGNRQWGMLSRDRINMKTPSYQYKGSHYKYKTAVTPSYLYNGNLHTWKDRLLSDSLQDGFVPCGASKVTHTHYLKYVLENIYVYAETKWTPFRRRYFHMHFLEWKCINFN